MIPHVKRFCNRRTEEVNSDTFTSLFEEDETYNYDLPNELWLFIFTYLDLSEIRKLRCVSSAWRDLIGTHASYLLSQRHWTLSFLCSRSSRLDQNTRFPELDSLCIFLILGQAEEQVNGIVIETGAGGPVLSVICDLLRDRPFSCKVRRDLSGGWHFSFVPGSKPNLYRCVGLTSRQIHQVDGLARQQRVKSRYRIHPVEDDYELEDFPLI